MKRFLWISGLLFFGLAVLVLRPVPQATEDNIDTVHGVVKRIFEGGVKDIVFRLEDHETTYYINRGLEAGYDLQEMQDYLIGREVEISYPRYWTPLDPKNRIKHLSRLIVGDSVVFTEVRP